MLPPLTPEEIAWVERQPIIGDPGLSRVRAMLKRAGFASIELTLTDGGEGLEFRVVRSAGLAELNDDLMTRLLISVMRRSGFDVGFSEVAIVDMNETAVNGFTYTASLQQLFDFGAPQVGP